mgnify:FL=1
MIIENGGILTTVQDGGRFGYEPFGVSPSGPMDRRSFEIANLLVGNDRNEACLEATVIGPSISFTEDAVVAIAGADMGPRLNGVPVPHCRAFAVRPGDTLRLGVARAGCRAYLAFAGGLDVPLLMNSRSTMVGKGFGGYRGRRLKQGDEVGLRQDIACLPDLSGRVADPEPIPTGERALRVILGPQDDRFTEEGIVTFLSSRYTIGADFDRQGYRLEGPKIRHVTDGNIISDGIVFGSVQVPTSGDPIVMMAEHQTVGGYAKIATVITVDLPVLGQCKAGDAVRFVRTSVEEAERLAEASRRELDALAARIEKSSRRPARRSFKVTVDGRAYNVTIERKED